MKPGSSAGRPEIVLVYPTLLGVYGDRGNAAVLFKRLQWRGFDPVLTVAEVGDSLPDSGDIYVLGGSEDASQLAAARALQEDGELIRSVARGAVVFAVCAGYQILGTSFSAGADDREVDGLGLLDVTTRRGPTRAVGEMLSRWDGRADDEAWITGFENHAGYTELGSGVTPLAALQIGVGNRQDGSEGAVHGNVIGTYAHGPVLARNPALADHVLELALGVTLSPLVEPELSELRRQRIRAVLSRRRRRVRWPLHRGR